MRFDNGTSTISCDDVQEFDDDLMWQEESEKMKAKERTDKLRSLSEKIKKEKDEEQSDDEDDMEGNFAGIMPPNIKF